jgi:cell division protein FtsL
MRESSYYLPVILVIIIFLIIFTYLSMNLKSRHHGYEIENLTMRQSKLKNEIDKLLVKKERLLNLERVERIVINELHYQVPVPEQILKVDIDEN